MVRVVTAEEKARRRLASLLEGYLSGERWAKEKALRDEIGRLGTNALEEVLDSPQYSYLDSIDPPKLESVRKKFLKRRVVLQA